MRKVFQAELQTIGEELHEMSQAVAEAMERAYEAFESADTELAQEVIAGDARIDFMQNQLDERAIQVLALQGPVASDLRTIVGSLRMSASLERMGDLARHIAQQARRRYPDLAAPEPVREDFRQMADHCVAVATEVVRLAEAAEVLAAVGLILPGLTRIKPGLVVAAAATLVAVGAPTAQAADDGPGPVVAGGMLYVTAGNGGIVGMPGNVLLAFDTSSRLAGLNLLSSGDTPSHVKTVQGDDKFFEAFVGKTWDELTEDKIRSIPLLARLAAEQ